MYTHVSNPYCKIKFATEEGNLEIFQLANSTTEDNLDFDILSVNTTRDIGADDCATFSIVLAFKQEWYDKIHSCDLVVIELGRGEDKGTVLYGMVDTSYKSLVYVDLSPKRVINITGRGFNKAFMQFDIGAVQEINAFYTYCGFYKGQDAVIDQNSPSQLIKTVIDFYLDKGIDLKFANGKSFKDYFNAIYLENARQQEESLGNNFSAYEFQGSLWSYLKELRNAPFNELFWEIVDEKPTLISRPTPFNPTDWQALTLYKIDDKDVMDEELGRSDLESYTVYSVKGESLITDFDQLFGPPIWYKPFYKRYGLRRLQVTSKYASSGAYGPTGDSEGSGEWDVGIHEKSDYEKSLEDYKKEYDVQETEKAISDAEEAAKSKKITDNKVRQETHYHGGSKDELNYKKKKLKEEIIEDSKEEAKSNMEEVISEANKQDDSQVSQKTIDLFNWNIKNSMMENGSFIVRGDTTYKVGCRLLIESSNMEYYIENVSHNFVYSEGWKTTLQVTRGFEFGKRFTNPWNQWTMISVEDMSEISGIDYSSMDIPAAYGQGANDGFVPIKYSDPTGFRRKIGAIARSHAGEEYDMGSLRMNDGISDCSSLVYKVAMEAQGRDWHGTWAPATYTMVKDGEAMKLWYSIPLSEVQPWDILLRDGHTEFLSDDGRTFGAHDYGIPSGPGRQYSPANWTSALRIYGL